MARCAIAMLQNWDGEAKLHEFPHYLEIGESCGCTPPVKTNVTTI